MIARSCIGVNRKMRKCFWRPGRRRTAGAARRRRLCLRFRPPGEKRRRRGGKMAAGCGGETAAGCLWGKMAAGCCGRGWQRAAADGDGSGLLRTGTAAVCCGRGRQRAAADGRPAGRAAKPHTAPAGGGGGLRPGGAEGLPAVLLRGAAARPQKTRPGKPQFSGPGFVLIDSPCARSGGVFPPGSGQDRWYRRGSW